MTAALVAAAWDGQGVDPWLPQRLASESTITAAERKLYGHWWGSFSRWLVGVRRGVMSGVVPDPHAVWAQSPLWAAEMAAFAGGPVLDTVGLAYEQIFGPDYLFDARPAVTSYLAEVENRMVRTPEEVFNLVASEVAQGAAVGDSIPTVAARIDEVLTATGTERWRNRAVTVARTETIGALNAGRQDAFVALSQQLDDSNFEQQWLATIDRRVRLAHANADLQRVALGQPFLVGGEQLKAPGDPNGSAENVINCRCTTLLVRPGENVDLSNRAWTDYENA